VKILGFPGRSSSPALAWWRPAALAVTPARPQARTNDLDTGTVEHMLIGL